MSYNINDAPAATPQSEIELSNIYYNCTECSSMIEILSINEENNIIEFKCLNKEHEKKVMPIKEYLSKINKNKQKNINEDRCKEHLLCKDNRFVSYCFDCNRNLCKECLKSRSHINHNKNNIIEIKPIKEELNIIEEIIKDYKKKIENLKSEKKTKEKELKNMIINEKEKENKIIEEKLKIIKKEKDKELKVKEEKYILDIEKIKRKYEKELKERKEKYEEEKNEIDNKYKLKNEKERLIYEFKIEKLIKKINDKIKNLEYDKKIENMINIKQLNEIVYNTYNNNNDNYFNCANINNILVNYYKNEDIRNRIMRGILNNNYEGIMTKLLKKRDEDIKIKMRKEEKEILEKEINIKIEKMKEEYNKKINEIVNGKEKEIKDIEMKLNIKIEEYENNIRKKQNIFNKEIETIKNKISYILYNII